MISKSKPKYRYTKVVSEQLRHGTAEQRKYLEKWVNQRKFKNRKPTAEELTEEYLRKDSPLYGMVEPRPDHAAKKYWRQSSQDILRHINVVRIEIVTGKIVGPPVRAWVDTGREKGGTIPEGNYIPTQRLMHQPKLTNAVMQRAKREFESWLERYERYTEFLDVVTRDGEAYIIKWPEDI